MKILRKRGDTSNILQVFIQNSSSTTGAGLTGLTSGSSGLSAYYHKDTDTTATAISLVTMTVGTFTSSGFKEIDATNMPGWYQFCPPDAALAASGTPHSVGFHLFGASNMAPLALEVQLIAADVEDTVRLGLTALPNVASGSAGAIPTTGTGSNQISVSSGQVILQTGTGTGQLDFTSGVVKANATQWLGGTIPAVNVTGVPLVDLKYTLGTISPAAAGSVRADAVTGAVGSVTGNVGGSVASLTTNNDKTGYALTSGERSSVADALLDRDMSTGADSGSPTVRTVRQALRFLRNKWTSAAGTLTIYKEDDSTSSWTATVSTDGSALPIVGNDPA